MEPGRIGEVQNHSAYAARCNRSQRQGMATVSYLWRRFPSSLQTTLFGVEHQAPLIVAPVGVQTIMHPEAELATARAASKVGVTFCLSTAATRSIEEVAEASGSGHRWYQLYWYVIPQFRPYLPAHSYSTFLSLRPVGKEYTVSLLQRAKASGFTALVITLDTMLLGWRPHDLDTSYLPFLHGVGAQVGLSDPVFMAKHGKEPMTDVPAFPYDPKKIEELLEAGDERTTRMVEMGREWMRQTNSGTFRTWEDLKFVRANWDGPLILKGIVSLKVRRVHGDTLLHTNDDAFRMQNLPYRMVLMGSSYLTMVKKKAPLYKPTKLTISC